MFWGYGVKSDENPHWLASLRRAPLRSGSSFLIRYRFLYRRFPFTQGVVVAEEKIVRDRVEFLFEVV